MTEADKDGINKTISKHDIFTISTLRDHLKANYDCTDEKKERLKYTVEQMDNYLKGENDKGKDTESLD